MQTSQDQVADLIELLALSGWTISIQHNTTDRGKPWRVEGQHPRYAVTTTTEGETLVDAIAPFEAELPTASRESLMAARRERSAK